MKFQHTLGAPAIFAALSWLAAPLLAAEATFTAAQLRADLVELDRALHTMPADLSHSVDVPALERALRDLDTRFERSAPLTRDEAWRVFATLNPLLGDGHLFVGLPDWRGEVRAHLARGGRLFPFAVVVSPDCRIRIRHDPQQPLSGRRLRQIDGVSAAELCERMLARTHGDTRVFRADLLSRRFWLYYWKLFGAPDSFAISVEKTRKRRYPGSRDLPALLETESSFQRQFRLEFLPDHPSGKPASAAVLTLGTFAWPEKDEVLGFTRHSFETLQRLQIQTLFIDLRDNGGGNDDQWIEGVMPYLATRPFRTASTYRKRVVTPDPAKNEAAGDVVDGEIATWYAPQLDHPARFSGKVYVVVGTGTYSSAVVMSTVIQDFGFGTVIGPADSVRAGQSGGTRSTTLTNTGLILVAPRFVLTRPSGAKQPVLFRPDIGWDPRGSLEDLGAMLPK